MNEKLTPEQIDAINSKGKVIVSASAGSGKTFVMIQKLANLIEEGGDLEEILAVTFTKKAAAQMKEKLRNALISRLENADEQKAKRIKAQLSKIPSADISTIHSFCSHLVRTYFYALDIDSSFDIIADDDAVAKTLKNRAIDNIFDELYENGDKEFDYLLKTLRRKRSDDNIKSLLLDALNSVRMTADYEEQLKNLSSLYTHETFERVCNEYKEFVDRKCSALIQSVNNFENNFYIAKDEETYAKLFEEMRTAFNSVIQADTIFCEHPPLTITTKPRATPEVKKASDEYADFRKKLGDKYKGLFDGLENKQTEEQLFIKSGKLVCAFADVLLKFDKEYTNVKRDEGKLDYNDLEHLTLKLLENDEIKAQINGKYKHVFVDEYQDVNPVQERIVSGVGAENVFTVGDVKQAIYGFRGSKSLFFAQKYNRMEEGEDGTALKLSNNFRSSDGVINFVNALFSQCMVNDVCQFNYRDGATMIRGGGYPDGYGLAQIHIFGDGDDDDDGEELSKDEKKRLKDEQIEAGGIYSVAEHAAAEAKHSREGLAVLEIVKRELKGQHYDLKKKTFVDTQPGDICILSRKRGNDSIIGVVKTLIDAGYSVAGAKEVNVCDRAEVKQLLDILSYIDNCQQDIPLASALLSPLGNLTDDELAKIKIAKSVKGEKLFFRECAINYATTENDQLAHKLAAFFKKIYEYRKLSDILGASALIDKILIDSGLAVKYSEGNGEKLAGIRRLQEEAFSTFGELSLNAFLSKLKSGGYRVNSPAPSSSDSIKVMTMHASKGLEFPVVIIADAAAQFTGMDYSEMPFDDVYGFAPKFYDVDTNVQYKTMLQRVCSLRSSREDLKNELNLFYVACTRAMCHLHIMTKKVIPYDLASVLSATSYAALCDFARFKPEQMGEYPDDIKGKTDKQILISQPDEALYNQLKEKFMRQYPRANSVDLPVKSSASQLLKRIEDDSYYAENTLYPKEEEDKNYSGQTGAERGTAYHRFLQLCDFSKKSKEQIEGELKEFVDNGEMTEGQVALLNVDNLVEILAMPVFDKLSGCTLYREREFLCQLPANQFLDTTADDGVLVQGAIDLLATGKGGTAIIDYKYSKKSDDELVSFYSAQLALYKKAVARILKINEETISTTIVNIYSRRQINLQQ